MTLTDDNLDAIRQHHADALTRPHGDTYCECAESTRRLVDARLALVKEDVPALLAEVDALTGDLAVAVHEATTTRAALRTLRRTHREYQGQPGFPPICDSDGEHWPCESVRVIDAALGDASTGATE